VLYGITETIGTDRIFASNRTALAAYLDHRRVGDGS
jgi:hypothetical protein